MASRSWLGKWSSLAVGFAAMLMPLSALAQDAVTVRAVPQHGTVAPEATLVIAVELDHADGYHTWPAKAVKLPTEVDEFAIRTEIELIGPEAWLESPTRIQWPTAKDYDLPSLFEEGKRMQVALYSGKAVGYVLGVAPKAPGDYDLQIRVGFQACDESACLMPESKTLSVKVTVAAGALAEGAGNEPVLFKNFKADTAIAMSIVDTDSPSTGDGGKGTGTAATGAASAGDRSTAGSNSGVASAPVTSDEPVGGGVFLGLNLGSGLIVLGLFSILGGFLLNLTPCVLPVIPIKIMTLTQHAASPGKALVLGLYMASGVIAFWVAIGIPMAFVSANLDPSKFIFGVWWITLSIGLIIALMGFGIMGLFTLNLPQSVYSVNTKADSPGGSFMFGVLTAVLGLPCFGFVAGGLLAGAATLPPLTIMAIFGGIGIGMALPYLVLSAKPSLIRFIPRTGPASELVKQVMGLLLLAAAAFFLTAGIKAAIIDRPYLTGSIGWWAVGFFVLLAGVWMTFRILQISKAAWPKVVIPLLALLMVGGILLFANDKLSTDQENYQIRQSALSETESGEVPTGVWIDYTTSAFNSARRAGKSVLLDFTADWCINCKIFKRLILDAEPTKSRLAETPIVLMEVDFTSTNSPGWKLLQQLGRTGIPTWVIYGPDGGDPVVLDLTKPTHTTVLEGLERAGVPMGSSATSTAAR